MDTPSPAQGPFWSALLARLSARSVALTVGLSVIVAVLLNPIFVTPFVVVLGRTLFLGIVMLLVFSAARLTPAHWLPRWLPRWLVPVTAVALAAPVFTAGLYVVSAGGSVGAFIGSPARVSGFALIAGAGLVLGLLTAGSALVRERLAEAERHALQLELEKSRLEKQAVDARLSVLQAQIEPHFLFNTLANVQALVEGGSPRAAPVLRSLIAYLRAAMPGLHGAPPTLGQELARVRAYLELMQLRMPDRLAYEVNADASLLPRHLIPMSLLTLVENAVSHGIDPSEDGGRIAVGARLDAGTGRLHLWVADTGIGMSETAAPGTGLSNLRARLLGSYGADAELQISDVSPHGLRAEIVLPP